ncbi:MAG: LON peptidase substrate-binding domain-containing protein [Fimbriimonadaceae bacterium]|nr:LON peptidase substrate-binding domain-containing protein [Fimbriimonadaceae bacterium]
MAEPLEEIPLFPLQAVLFPLAPLDLHIFEPRYLQMISRCREEGSDFGIVLIRRGAEVGEPAEPHLVGTRAGLESVRQDSPGRLNIRVRGGRRFRIRRLLDDGPLLRGLVEPLDDIPGEDDLRLAALASRAREVGESYISQLFAGLELNITQVRLHHDPIVLSFLLAALTPAEDLVRQRMLETTDTADRLVELTRRLEEAAPKSQTERLRAEEALARQIKN